MTENTLPNPPPPPPTGKKPISKMLIAAILIVIIVVAAVAGAVLLMQPKGPSPTASPSGTSNPNNPYSAQTPAFSVSPSSTNHAAGANSLKYSVEITGAIGIPGTYTFMGKNAGTDNFMVRVEIAGANASESMKVIVNGAQKKAWTNLGAGSSWIDVTSDFNSEWSDYQSQWASYVDSLAGWSGSGDYTYTYAGTTVRIFDIQVNPNLSDSLFQP
jgi:hypothetical protein